MTGKDIKRRVTAQTIRDFEESLAQLDADPGIAQSGFDGRCAPLWRVSSRTCVMSWPSTTVAAATPPSVEPEQASGTEVPAYHRSVLTGRTKAPGQMGNPPRESRRDDTMVDVDFSPRPQWRGFNPRPRLPPLDGQPP